MLADLGNLRDQVLERFAMLDRLVVRRLGLPVRGLHLVHGPARLRHEHLRALADGEMALLDGVLQRPLHLAAGVVQLLVRVLHLLERVVRLLLGLVLLLIVRLGELVVLGRGGLVLVVGLPDRVVLHLARRLGGLVGHRAGRVGAHGEVHQHLRAVLLGRALEVLPELLHLGARVLERLLHDGLELLRGLVGALALGLLQVPRVPGALERLLQHLLRALEHLGLDLLEDAIDRVGDLLLHLLRDLLELLLRLFPRLAGELGHLAVEILRGGDAVLLRLLQRLLAVLQERLRGLVRLARLIDQLLPLRLGALHLRVQFLVLRLRVLVGGLALVHHRLGLLDGLLDARHVALERRLRRFLGVLEQLLDGLDRELHLRLGVVHQRVDLLLRRIALLLEILLRLVQAGGRLLRGVVGVLLRLCQQALPQLARRLDRLLQQLLRGVVSLLRVVQQRLAQARCLLRELRFQLLQLGLRRLPGLLALGEDGLRVPDGLLGVGLRPLHRVVGRALRVLLQLLRLLQRGADLLLRLVHRLADQVLRGAALVLEGLLRAVILRALLVVHLGRVRFGFLQEALPQLSLRGDGLVEQLLRHRHRVRRLVDDGLRHLLRPGGHLRLQLGQLLLRRLLRRLALGEDGLRLIDRRLGRVLVPAPGLLRRLGGMGMQLLHLRQRRLHLRAGAVHQRRDLVLRLAGGSVELLVGRVVSGGRRGAGGGHALLHALEEALGDLAHRLPRLLHQLVRLVERDLRLREQLLHRLRALGSERLQLVAGTLRLLERRLELVARGLGRIERLLRLVLRELPRLLGGGLALGERLLRLLQRHLDLPLQLLARGFDVALALPGALVDAAVRVLCRRVRIGGLLHGGRGAAHRLVVLGDGRGLDRGVVGLAALEQRLDLLDQPLERLLHVLGHVVVRALGGVLGGVRLGLELPDQRLRGLRDVLGSVEVLRLRLLDGLLQLADQLLRKLERLEAVLLRLLHRRGQVLQLLDVGLVRVVELLRLVDLLLHLDGELLRLARPLADLLLDLLDGLRQHAVGLVAAVRGQHGLHLVDQLLQDLLHVLGHVRVRLLGGRLARLRLLLRLVERHLGAVHVGLGAVEVVLLRLVERGLALV